MLQLYATYPKENLLTITARVEKKSGTIVGYAFLRFSKGMSIGGVRTYDTKDAPVIKLTKFELATLAEALVALGSGKEESYKKYADASRSRHTQESGVKVLEAFSDALQLCHKGECVRLKLHSYELMALGRDLRQMVAIMNERIWSGKS